jgi:hypothetical protein
MVLAEIVMITNRKENMFLAINAIIMVFLPGETRFSLYMYIVHCTQMFPPTWRQLILEYSSATSVGDPDPDGAKTFLLNPVPFETYRIRIPESDMNFQISFYIHNLEKKEKKNL